MADLDSERDRRVRELLSDQSNKKDQLSVINQAQSEIGDIQSELRNHLAMEQAQDQSRLQEAQTISQAAQGMMEMEGEDQLQGQVSSMNPQTQAALGKFGVKPGKTQNTSRNQSSGRLVTQTGAVTNIKTENITNNHTDIRVTQPTIPMSQPTISVQPQKKEDNTSKFKAWLSGMFAKQQNEAEIQRKEYRKKEWNLGRTTSRLMKRIADATSGLSSRLDPKNMTSTLGGQLKWLLLIFGATMMSKFWKPTMKFLANLEGGFRAVFGLPMNDDLRQASSGTLSVIDQIKDFIGIKKGENDTLIGGIGKVFMEGIDKLIDKLKFWFEDRASALKDVEFPNIETPDFGPLGKVMAPIMEGLTDTFKGLTQYIGDLITVAMGGSKGRVKVAARKISRQAQDVFTDTTGKQTSAGDSGLVKGKGRDYMKDSDYDIFGNLKSNASSTQAMSRSLVSMFNDKSGKAHTAEIGTGVGQLFDVAKRSGQVVIDPELLSYLGLTQADVVALQRNKQLRQDKYRIIGVKPTTDAQRRELGAYTGNGGFWTGGVLGTAGGAWAGAAAGGALGSVIPGVGNVVGGVIGGVVGGLTGGYTGSALGAAGDNIVKNWTTRGLYPKLVKADSGERGDDGSLGVPKMMWVLTKEGADAVTAKFTRGMTNKDMDITNKEFYDKIRKIEERKKRQNGVRGALTQNLSTNDLQVAQSNYDAYNREWDNRFESKDPNSWNMQHYGHWNTTTDNLTGMISSAGSWAADGLRNGANFVLRERLGKSDQNKRAAYVINRFVKEGLTPEQAAGIAGNIMKESGFVANSKVRDNNGKFAGGIVGWNGPNLDRVERYFGSDIRQVPFEQQVEYLVKELKGEVNGIKAINRDGYASRFGFKTGANVLDVMKRTRSTEEAAVTYERIFEGSGDYKGWTDQYGRRRGGDGDKARMEYALGFHKLVSQNPNLAQGYESKPLPSINLSGLKDEDVTSGGKIGVGWLGDSQSCVCGGLFPILVGQGLGTSFKMYARGNANATHYLGTGNTKHLSSPTTNISGFSTSSTCKDALDWMLQNKPKYCFIELGHNGMSGYQNLVNKLRGVGIKVLCIKMWSTQAAPGTGMASYSKEKMADMYKGISADGMIDLTQLDVPKSKDGVHASKQGCMIAAREVLQQLSGASATIGSEEGSDDYLKTKEGLLGFGSEMVAGALNWAADKLEGNNGISLSADYLDNLTNNMTKEQKKAFNNSINRMAQNEALNVMSWESLGAKSDNKGTYFQNGDIRTYVKTDEGHSGIFGLREEDIDWIERVDKNGKTAKVQLTDDELMIASKSAVYSVDSLFSDYPEKTKGNGYNDFMNDKTGKPLGFYIGEFKDIESFKDPAPKDFKGKIRFWIFPTKDLKKWNMVGIGETRKCSLLIVSDTRAGERYYGPIIYHKGAHWFAPGTLKSEKKYIDYQPICYYLNVKLTPSAQIKAMELINFLNTSGNITEKNGKFYDQNGKELSDETIRQAKEYGIISKENVIGADGNYIGRRDVLKSGYKEAISQGKSLETKKFNLESYSTRLNIGSSVKDREDYYNKHKELFRTIDGVLYGPQGLKWGTVDKSGKISFYENQNFSSIVTKEGQSGLEKNLETIQNKDNEAVYKSQGFVSRETMAKFLFGASDYSREGSKITSGKEVMRAINGVRNLKITGNNNIAVPYKAYIRSDGSVYKYVVTKDHVRKALENAGYKNAVFDFKTIEAKNLDSLDNSLIARFDNSVFKGRTNWIGSKIKTKTGNNRNRNAIDSYTREMIRKGKRISNILSEATGQTIVFEDGERYKIPEVFGFSWGKPNDETKTWINQINSAIDLRNKQLKTQAINDSFRKSGMESLYKSFAEDANSGKLKYVNAFDNYVATIGGDVFGVRGQDGKIRSLNGGEAYQAAINYFNQSNIKEDFLKKSLGLKSDGHGKSFYEITGSDGKRKRVQLDLTKDLSNFMESGLSGMTTGNAQQFINGRWQTLSGDENQKALRELKTPLNDMKKNSGFTNKLIQILKDAMVNKMTDAAKARVRQLNLSTEQKSQQKQSNTYLKQIAENGLSSSDLKALENKIDNIKLQENTDKKANESFTGLAERLKNQGKNLGSYTVIGDRGRKFAIGSDQMRLINKAQGNGDGRLSKEELQSATPVKITATDQNGHQQAITIINEGGKYFIYNPHSRSYSGLNVDGTLAAYETK